MEPRKTNRADLEPKRTVFLQLGLIISISAALAAFEWKTPDYGDIILPKRTAAEPVTDIIDVVVDKKTELPKPVNTTILIEVENNREDVPDIEIKSEIGQEEKVAPYKLPELLPEEPDPSNEPFTVVEQQPEFPGGDAALMKYLSENTIYPATARETGISGTVYITFVIETDGSVSSIGILRKVDGGCTEEAIRVVSEMPRWTPGKQRGKPVRVRMNLPVKFILRN